MKDLSHPRRLGLRILCVSALISSALLPELSLAAGNATFELRPHCETGNPEENRFGGPMPDLEQLTQLGDGHCAKFPVRDPQNLQTEPLKEGDTLDMDLVIKNPDGKKIERFRAWIAYDATALEGADVTISPDFPLPTPGENAFAPTEGFIKLSGSTTKNIRDKEVVVARIRMKAKAIRFEGTPLTYFDLSGTETSKTGIFEKNGTTESDMSAPNPGYLFVRFATTANQSSSQNSSVAPAVQQTSSLPTQTASFSSKAATVTPSTVFNLLQVKGLRVTTDGSSVFLAWDTLPSAELIGYNMYYGTTTGRYIQKRSVDAAASSITIRSLPVGTTYYFAVRGVNAGGQETEFSQEVAVSVGNPRTSTSPLAANSLPTKTPGTNGTVSGETGTSSVFIIVLAISGVIGTALAFRRQFTT